MPETVSTGGTKSFHYKKGYEPKLDEERKKEIEEAYEKYDERKAAEKKRKNITIAVIVLIIVAIALFFILT